MKLSKKKTTLQTEVQDYTIKVSELSGKENKYFEITSLRKSHNRVGRLFSVTADLTYFE